MAPRIRQAHPDECSALTEVAMRSKAHWGYDAQFMVDVRRDLTVIPEKFVPGFHVYLLENEDGVIGFSALLPADAETIELDALFVEPQHIGFGHGKRLWQHSLQVAQTLGFRRLVLSADPFAEAFYASQGAVRIGEKESNARARRMLSVMECRFNTAKS